jgi:hypothetical protein
MLKKKVLVLVNDKMQKNYAYELTEKMGENFDKSFKPDLSPKQMLELGVFGGTYMTDCEDEFPEDWFQNKKGERTAKFAEVDIFGNRKYEKKLNYFGVKASQSLAEWRKNGWINNDDPRGWFQWYCRYFMGRRHADDARQIRRWVNMKRHVIWLQGGCGVRGSLSCRPRQRQALLHWGYDSRNL